MGGLTYKLVIRSVRGESGGDGDVEKLLPSAQVTK